MAWNEFRGEIDNVIYLMKNDKKIEAIKALRAASSLGLKEAKDIVEAFYNYVQPKKIDDGPNYDQVPYQEPKESKFAVVRQLADGTAYYVVYDYEYDAMHEAQSYLDSGTQNVYVCKVIAETKRTLVKL